MDKFQETIQGLVREFANIKEILIVYLYGSVARKDYSLRHSDLDLFIVINKEKVSQKIKDKINDIIIPFGARLGARVHPEYQGLKIIQEDKTLMQKMIEEGKIIYSSGILSISGRQLGLDAYFLYEYSTKDVDQKTRTKLTQILHGRNVKGKIYKGIADKESVILVGKTGLLIRKDKRSDVESAFRRLGVDLKLIKLIFS